MRRGLWILLGVLLVAGAGAQPSMPRVESKLFLFPIAVEDYLAYSSYFGWRVSPTLNVQLDHEGLDIATVEHAIVLAVADGVVAEPWPPPGKRWLDGRYYPGDRIYGGNVKIRHGNGLTSFYAHLSELWVQNRQKVRAGQPIGRTGRTGIVSGRGDHLHFGILVGVLVLNPLLYISLPVGKG